MGFSSTFWQSLLPCCVGALLVLGPVIAHATPEFDVRGSLRTRYESLEGPIRRLASGSDQLLAKQLLIDFRANTDRTYAELEFADSRAWLNDAGTPLGTDDVNATELLQGYVGTRLHRTFVDDDSVDLRAGRLTLDLGSRRLIARNQFRNTINSFIGAHATWQRPGGDRLQLFATLPKERARDNPPGLDATEIGFNWQSLDSVLLGLLADTKRLPGGMLGSFFLYVFDEGEGQYGLASERTLFTPGVRLFAQPAPGRWDGELELAVQTGRSRAFSLAADGRTLRHRAGFVHVHAGRTLERPWQPRLVAQFDYASGDDDPLDDRNGHFDTLFGARRFEYGPTGIFGPFTRANLLSPGARLEFVAWDRVDTTVGYRVAWLAEARDRMDGTGLRDPSGASGRFIGQQLEVRVRGEAVPGRLHLEAGAAYLIHGSFLERAPGAPDVDDSTYVYLQTTLRF